MEAVAKLRNCPMSPRKMRMVADVIRGKSVENALNILRFNKRESSFWLEKLLLSSIANWENKSDMSKSADEFDLYIKQIFVDGGTSLKDSDQHRMEEPTGLGKELIMLPW